MGKRKKNILEKSVPAITFKFRPEINFSISMTRAEIDSIHRLGYDKDSFLSKSVLRYIFNKLLVKNYQELNKYSEIKQANDFFRIQLYKILNLNNREFSKFIREELRKDLVNENTI